MSNFINPSMIAAEALDQLEYELVAGNLLYRDKTSDFDPVRGYKVGDTVTIRTVSDFLTKEFVPGTPIDPQEITQSSTTLPIEKHFDVSITVGAKEKALNLDGIRKEVVNPAMVSLAQKIDTYLLTKITEAQGLFTSASLLTTAAEIAQANKQATRQQISKVGRIGLVNDELEAVMLGTDIFHKYDTRGTPAVSALQEAQMNRLMGTDWYSSVNMPNVTYVSGDGATTLNNGGPTNPNNPQGASSLTVQATTGTFNEDDKIRIVGAKRDFTVAAEVLAGATEIPLKEQINENLAELDNFSVQIRGGGNTVDIQGVMFNMGAFGFAAPPLDEAEGDQTAVLSDNGMSIRYTAAYDINNKTTIWSFDVLIGAAAIDARKAMLLGQTS